MTMALTATAMLAAPAGHADPDPYRPATQAVIANASAKLDYSMFGEEWSQSPQAWLHIHRPWWH
jgi:hypothetical protein